MKLDLIDIFYTQGENAFKIEIENLFLEDLMKEHHSSKKFMACTDYHNLVLKIILEKAYATELKVLKPIIDNDFKHNENSYLHNRMVAAYCGRIGVTLKELLEYRSILKEHYSCGHNFAIDFHIEHLCFKKHSPIPAEDANVEYDRYVPDEIKKKKEEIDFWLVNTLLKKMILNENMAKQMYFDYKQIGHGFGMKRAASAIKKE